MIYLVEEHKIFSIFNINSFYEFESLIASTAPSLFEYHINNLISSEDSSIYFNKSNIQDTIYTDLYNIYLDYESKVYIEVLKDEDEFITESLW